MSCWMVSNDHVDLLVSAMIDWKIIEADQAQATGEALLTENAASFTYRYEGRYADEAEWAYTFRPVEVLPHAVVVKSIDCFNYQACEHPGWEASEAYRLTATLLGKYKADQWRGTRSYNDAPWGYERDSAGDR